MLILGVGFVIGTAVYAGVLYLFDRFHPHQPPEFVNLDRLARIMYEASETFYGKSGQGATFRPWAAVDEIDKAALRAGVAAVVRDLELED